MFPRPNVDLSFQKSFDELKRTQRLNSTEGSIEKLKEMFERYQLNINDDENLAIQIANFGQSITVVLTGISALNNSIISIDGIDVNNGLEVQLVQHISQLNLLFTKVSTVETEIPKQNTIGFNF